MVRKKVPRATKKELVRWVFYNQKNYNVPSIRLRTAMIEDVFDLLFYNIGKATLKGEHVYLRGFATFRPLRTALVTTPSGRRLFMHTNVFKPSKNLLQKLNRGGNDVFGTYFSNTADD